MDTSRLNDFLAHAGARLAAFTEGGAGEAGAPTLLEARALPRDPTHTQTHSVTRRDS